VSDRAPGPLSGTESATLQALFRIAMGVGVLHTFLPVVWRGLVPLVWTDRAYGGIGGLGEGSWQAALLGGPTPAVIGSLVAAVLVAGAAMVLGVGGRIAPFVALQAGLGLTDSNSNAGGSYDMLLSNGLWLCVLSGGHHTLSVEAWWRTGRWWPRVEIWSVPHWLIGWQLVLMYCTTGFQKVSAYWVPGGESSALYYILQQPEWHRFDMAWLAPLFPLTQLATLLTWFWEVLSPLWLLAVWFAATPERTSRLRTLFAALRLRWIYTAFGIGTHLAILVTMDVGPFSYLSLAFYVAMATPEEWEALLLRVTGSRPT
jgi:hypothetical protein